jgi:signal transduction histidine kinase
MRPAIPRSFLLQAALILLPVVLLAGYGLWALRKEKASIEEEVRERCLAVLPLLVREIPRAVEDAVARYVESERLHYTKSRADAGQFLLSPASQLNEIFPGAVSTQDMNLRIESRQALDGNFAFARRPAATWSLVPARLSDGGWKRGIPEVPNWFEALPHDQLKDWQAIEYALAGGQRDEALRLIDDFISGPSDYFAERNAKFLRRQLETPDIAAWLQAASSHDDVLSPAGLPLSGLCLLRALELNGTNQFDNALWAVLARWFDQPPTSMTAAAMSRVDSLVPANDPNASARLAAVHLLADRHRLTALALDQFIFDPAEPPPVVAWVNLDGDDYLAWSGGGGSDPTNRVIHGSTVPAEWLLPRVVAACANVVAVLPDYISLHLQLAGKSIALRPGIALASEAPVLAQENFVLNTSHSGGRPGPVVSLDAHLASPELMYRRHEHRVWMVGSLIAMAVVAAACGLSQALRTLRRQLALNELKTNFVSSVSHELRAPIASVRLMAENLERGKVTGADKLQEYVRFIGQECRRLSALIENVLDFGRIEQGRKQYEFEPTDLGKLVEETVRLMQPYAEERGVRLKVELEGRDSCRPAISQSELVGGDAGGDKSVALPIELNIDGRAIQQALVNLIDNAVKHSPGGAAVTIELAATPNAKPETLTISVTDHGPGIPQDEHEKIFERFYRRGSELRRETQGIGIGLSIVKHIVDAHGGRMWVESEPGKGSRFVIELRADR